MIPDDETKYTFKELIGKFVKNLERQRNLNISIHSEIKEIKEFVNTFQGIDLSTRLTAVEECQTRIDFRLSNIEKLLKAKYPLR